MRRVLRSGVWAGAIFVALGFGCGESRQPTLTHGGGTGGTGGAAVAGSAGQPVIVTQPSFLDSCAGMVPRSPLNRWSLLDLDQSLDGWFGPGEKLASVAWPDFEYNRDLSRSFVDALLHVAQQRVKAVVADDDVFEICADDATEQPGCIQVFLREWGSRLYRQPLTSEQLEAYVVQFRSALGDHTPAQAARNALVSMVLSPYVVLRLEMGDPKVTGRLAAHEIAARLSHFAARRAPDAELLSSAATGALQGSEDRKQQLRRMWSTVQGRQGRALTHLDWLGIRPDNERQDLSVDLRADMATQVTMLVDDLLQGPSPTLLSLLTASRQPLNQRLATHYGVRVSEGDGFQYQELDPTLFAGVLATGAFLSRFQRPTARGLQVLDALLCTEVPPSPPNLNGELPETGTPRARITAATSTNPVCIGCHQVMDPVGFALEAFDDQGRITNFDTAGSVPPLVGTATRAVANPRELAATIAASDSGRACAARRYLEFALDRKIPASSTTLGLPVPSPQPPGGTAPLPTPTDPDDRWMQCMLQVSPGGVFDFTLVGEAMAASNLMLTRTDPSQRVVAFDTSVDPVEHAAQETGQFRGVFSNADDQALVERYRQALLEQLARQDVSASGGESGNGGIGTSGGAAGAGGAP